MFYCAGLPDEEFAAREFDEMIKTFSREGAKPQRKEFHCFVFFPTPRLRVKPLFLRAQLRWLRRIGH